MNSSCFLHLLCVAIYSYYWARHCISCKISSYFRYNGHQGACLSAFLEQPSPVQQATPGNSQSTPSSAFSGWQHRGWRTRRTASSRSSWLLSRQRRSLKELKRGRCGTGNFYWIDSDIEDDIFSTLLIPSYSGWWSHPKWGTRKPTAQNGGRRSITHIGRDSGHTVHWSLACSRSDGTGGWFLSRVI